MEAKEKKEVAKRGLILFLILSLFFIEGCWGKREVEQLAFVMALGIDLGEKPGDILVTYQIAQPKKGGQSGSDTSDWTLSTEVAHAPVSEEKVYEILNRHPFVGTTKILIIGEDLAESGMSDALDAFQRFYQFRRTMNMLVAKGKAKDILNTKLRNDQLPALSLLGRMEQSKSVSTFPVTRIGHYLTVLAREGQAPIIAAVEKLKSGEQGIEYQGKEEGKAEELRIEGAGVFRAGKLIDYLSDEETKGYMWLENEVESRYIGTGEVDGVSLTAKVVGSNTKYTVAQDKNGSTFQYQVKAQAELEEIKGTQAPMSTEVWAAFIKDAEKQVEQAIQKECQSAIDKSKGIPIDFLGIGRHIEQKKPSLWKEVRANWESTLHSLPVDLKVQVTLEHGGVARNSPVSPIETGQE